MPEKVRRVVPWIATAAVMTLILLFSSQDGSDSESLSFRVTGFLIRLFTGVEPDMTSAEFLRLDYLVRKLAHISEYCLLALCVLWALGTVTAQRALKYTLLYAICFTFAFVDEWRQTGVDGRLGCFVDVVIDQIGTVLAAVIHLLALRIRSRRSA